MESEMARKSPLVLLGDGRIAVTQRSYAGWEISWNPDDKMFYVHEPNENLTVRSIVRELRNARQYAATHVPGGEDDQTPKLRAWTRTEGPT
jgi:hypothetical protein